MESSSQGESWTHRLRTRLPRRVPTEINRLRQSHNYLLRGSNTVNGDNKASQQPETATSEQTITSASKNEENNAKSRCVKCNVCLEDATEIERNNRRLVTTMCGHLLCSYCADRVKETSSRCPVCKKTLRKRNPFIEIFL